MRSSCVFPVSISYSSPNFFSINSTVRTHDVSEGVGVGVGVGGMAACGFLGVFREQDIASTLNVSCRVGSTDRENVTKAV